MTLEPAEHRRRTDDLEESLMRSIVQSSPPPGSLRHTDNSELQSLRRCMSPHLPCSVGARFKQEAQRELYAARQTVRCDGAETNA